MGNLVLSLVSPGFPMVSLVSLVSSGFLLVSSWFPGFLVSLQAIKNGDYATALKECSNTSSYTTSRIRHFR